VDQVRPPLSLSAQQGKVTGFPPTPRAVVLIVITIVVVDVEAGRGGAPNNGKGICAEVHPVHQEQMLKSAPCILFGVSSYA